MNIKATVVRIAEILKDEGLFGDHSYSNEIKETFIKYVYKNNCDAEWNERGINIKVRVCLDDDNIKVDIEDISLGDERCGWDKDKIRSTRKTMNVLLGSS